MKKLKEEIIMRLKCQFYVKFNVLLKLFSTLFESAQVKTIKAMSKLFSKINLNEHVNNNQFLNIEDDRLIPFPIKYDNLWNEYKDSLLKFSNIDIDFPSGLTNFNNILASEQALIKIIIVYFSLVKENFNQFLNTTLLEIKYFYMLQSVKKNVHSEMYSLFMKKFVGNEDECKLLIKNGNFQTTKINSRITKWTQQPDASDGQKLLVSIILNGLMFRSGLASIYSFKLRNAIPEIVDFIERLIQDRNTSRNFGILLFTSKLVTLPPSNVIEDMIMEAVHIEKTFFNMTLPLELDGMKTEMMDDYIGFVADELFECFNEEHRFHTRNPYEFTKGQHLFDKKNM